MNDIRNAKKTVYDKFSQESGTQWQKNFTI